MRELMIKRLLEDGHGQNDRDYLRTIRSRIPEANTVAVDRRRRGQVYALLISSEEYRRYLELLTDEELLDTYSDCIIRQVY